MDTALSPGAAVANEDSGYHTPFTPGSTDRSGAQRLRARLWFGSSGRTSRPRPQDSGDAGIEEPARRALKRSLPEETDSAGRGSASTPTGGLAGGLQRLAVTEVRSPEAVEHSVRELATSDYFSQSSVGESSRRLSCPTTPVKSSRCKIAKLSPRLERNRTKRCSPTKAVKENVRRTRYSVKRLNFAQSGTESQKISSNSERMLIQPTFVPDKKIDIVTKLYEVRAPAVDEILSYLDGRDVYCFGLVSRTWQHICTSNPKAYLKRAQYVEYIDITKENHNNRESAKIAGKMYVERAKLSLKDINNLPNPRQLQQSPKRSPPGTPRTNKFKKYTKSASLDSRLQLSCVHCDHPAKVTKEHSGEEWAECSNLTCAYQFCRFCKCDRHPDSRCFRYEIGTASPSKRRKHSCAGTEKSRRILRRLLI